jgi:threonine dehydrogenase-like Zn-dependent dehydrogenase
MRGAVLPGEGQVELRDFPVPEPGPGEVLVKTKASTICGSDLRCIYHEHLGKGPERYQGTIAGHEPAGQIVACGPGMRRFAEGDRVVLYHISGCGLCRDCRRGYMISCSSPLRRAYGWQRDGGMADFILAEEKDLVPLPEGLTYTDGAQVACGFGTVYEALRRIAVHGADQVLVTGLGPVGLAALQLARALGAYRLIGMDPNPQRRQLAIELSLADEVLDAADSPLQRIHDLTAGRGCEKVLECSAHEQARTLAIRATRQWGSCVLIGEGNRCSFEPSPDLIHGQKNLVGSWVTSIWRMEELVEQLADWNLHPDQLVTHRFPLDRAAEAYATMARGQCGKVAVAFDEELL